MNDQICQENIQHTTEKFAENTFEQDKEYLLNKFQAPIFDPGTGLDNETIKKNLMTLSDELKNLPHPVVKAKAFEYVAGNVMIDVNPHDRFVGFGCWNRWDRPLSPLIEKWDHEINESSLNTFNLMKDHNRSGTSHMLKDFDHSVPDWNALFSLGIPGIRNRARQYRKECAKQGNITPETEAYFESIEIVYTAMIQIMKRFRDFALKHAEGNNRMEACAESLDTLVQGPPKNTYEVLQLIYLYFIFSEYIDRLQVRSLGNLDRTVYPYFVRDQKEGRYTETQLREFFSYFFMQWASIANPWGHPFYLGGTKENGESEINELSYLILEELDKLNICSPKLQIKISPNTPAEFTNKAIDMIRRGNSSIVFLCEPSIKRAMMGYGATEEEARTCDITGCYEFIPRARGNTTIPGIINMLKPIELVFNNGIDPETSVECGCQTGNPEKFKTFDDFYKGYLKQLSTIIESIITWTNDSEQHLSQINPTAVYSATIKNSLQTAQDAFHNGSAYNISSILTTGFATAVDALMAVKKYVFETQEITICDLKRILSLNWEGNEKLRLKMLHSRNKFGNGIDAVDTCAESLAKFLADNINMRPNARNGFFIASMHTPPKTYLSFGELTGATPDGRMAGDEVSRNMSPTMGMDINGVTALIRSVTKIDSASHPGDFPLDVMLHPASVQGDEGLAAMRKLLEIYMDKHGIAIQFNIFDSETLVDAQEHPEKYQGLQVRVCGWNVHFQDLCKKEQDAFIRRARNIKE